MSDDNFDLFDDDVIKNLEKLKAKYSDYGVDDEGLESISKNIIRSDPEHNAFDEDFADGFEDEQPSADYIDEEESDTEDVSYYDFEESSDDADDASAADEDIYSVSDSGIPANTFLEYEDDEEEDDEEETGDDIYFSAPVNKPQKSEPITEPVKNTEKKKSGGKSKKKKKKSHKLLTALLILFIIAVLWGMVFAVDIIFVNGMKEPIFCIKKNTEYENGSADYYGLFYKIQFHVDEEKDETSVHCMPWFIAGPNDELETVVNEKEEETTLSAEQIAKKEKENLTEVTITVPQKYLKLDMTEDVSELSDGQKQMGFISAKKNSNGSVTYKIGKGDYSYYLDYLKKETAGYFDSIADDTDFPSIQKVEYNDDFSEITLCVEKDKYLNSYDTFIEDSIKVWVGYYNSFAQKKSKCKIILKDIADDSIIDTNA